MLLERLVRQASDKPEFDWEGYYGWLYSELTGLDGIDLKFWICRHCLTINVLTNPRYGKCRECNLIYLGQHLRSHSTS